MVSGKSSTDETDEEDDREEAEDEEDYKDCIAKVEQELSEACEHDDNLEYQWKVNRALNGPFADR